MLELWLNFSDPDGVTRLVRVEGEKFAIGRHSDCDLTIADSRLSRKHAIIERFGSRYEISDAGSSNGTELRGAPVIDPEPVFDGDAISLGGLIVKAEIKEARAAAPEVSAPATAPAPPSPAKTKSQAAGVGKSVPLGLVLLAPILAVVFVVVVGGVVYLVVARNSVEIAGNQDETDPPITDGTPGKDGPIISKTPVSTVDDPPGPTGTPSSTDSPDGPPGSGTPQGNQSETAKIEANGSAFLQKAAQNDRRYFLTSEQAKLVSAKVKQLSNSSAVADNIKSAQKNAAQIRSLADSKNMKPQFLAVAAMAKLGNSRGDVLQTATSMVDVLDKLSIQLGNELGDDCLLAIAAFEQGAAGETMKMRNMLQDLAIKSSESSRTIRTIWFLQKQGKITQAEFDRALTFLAIGTISQNPKDFGVNAEALNV